MEIIHRFICQKNDHDFYISLKLPMDLSEFSRLLQNMKCPFCEATSKEIHMDHRHYQLSEPLQEISCAIDSSIMEK